MSRLSSPRQIHIAHERQLFGPENLYVGQHIGHIAIIAETPLHERLAVAALALSGLAGRVVGRSRLDTARDALRHGDDISLVPQWHGTVTWTDFEAVSVDIEAQLPDSGGAAFTNHDLNELPALAAPAQHVTYVDSLGLAPIGTHRPIANGYQDEAGRWYYAATVEMPHE